MWSKLVVRLSTAEEGEKVSKYLDLQLKILSFIGLFQLSPEKTPLQSLYTGFIFIFCSAIIFLGYTCAIANSSQDVIEFFKILLETIGIHFIFVENIFLNMKRRQLLELLDRMNAFDVTSQRRIFTISRRLEKLTFFVFGSLIFSVTGILLAAPFLPISSEELQHVQEVYELAYPRNRLPICLWLPFDSSRDSIFYFLYCVELYSSILWNTLGIVEALFMPFILLHLCGQHLVLSKQLRTLGQGSPSTKKFPMSRDSMSQEVSEMKKCVVFHQRLVEFRTLFNSVMGNNIRLRVSVLLLITALSTYPLTQLPQFDRQMQILIITESSLSLIFYYYNCLLSEILEWSNELLRSSLYQSYWYRMCPEAQRMMVLFLRRTQRSHRIRTLGGLVELGNINYVKTLKFVYTFIRFVNMKKPV